MDRSSALFATTFTAGVIGALINSLAAHYAGAWELTSLLGVKLQPELSLAWLYPRLVWGESGDWPTISQSVAPAHASTGYAKGSGSACCQPRFSSLSSFPTQPRTACSDWGSVN